MGKYRKKPVVIDAWQVDGTWFTEKAWPRELPVDCSTKGGKIEVSQEHAPEIEDTQKLVLGEVQTTDPKPGRMIVFTEEREIHIGTLEGVMVAFVGDWIIQGVKGEFYPCKNDIFWKTYEHADETEWFYEIQVLLVNADKEFPSSQFPKKYFSTEYPSIIYGDIVTSLTLTKDEVVGSTYVKDHHYFPTSLSPLISVYRKKKKEQVEEGDVNTK